MKQSIFAIVALTLATAAVPALAQTRVAPVTPYEQAAGCDWQLLQGSGHHNVPTQTWFCVPRANFSRYHGS